jgi:N-acetylglucosaminyldiphosphoundecaprenol N-acetyl-beta-D-mannosaminyltransferase
MTLSRIELFGLKVVSGRYDDVVDELRHRFSENSRPPEMIATLNSHFIDLYYLDSEFAEALNHCEIIVPDGMPLLWIAKAVNRKLESRITGRELFPKLCEFAAANQLSVYLFGDTEETLRRTADALKQKFPTIVIAGYYSPSFPFVLGSAEDERAVEMINQSNADLVFVALGAPRQEVWMYRNRKRLKVKAMVGLGASFRFFIGKSSVAPDIVQRMGLEWFWRLLHEPRRLWYRYTVGNVRFLFHSLRYIARVWKG